MKIITIILIGLFIFGMVFTIVNDILNDDYRTFQRKFTKYVLDKNCEFITLENGWTQVPSCYLYKLNETKMREANTIFRIG